MIVINAQSEITLDLGLDFCARLGVGRGRLNLSTELCHGFGRCQLNQRTSLSQLTITFKVTRVLVHRDVNNPTQDGKDLVLSLDTLFKLNVLVPERMRKEVEADTAGATLK